MLITARRALFTVLILLTAFRGAVGDVMAYGMTKQAIAINSIALSAASMPGNDRFDSKIMDSMPCHEGAAEQGVEASMPTSESVCSTCQVCHLCVTLPLSAVSCPPVLLQADKPSLRVSAWASADLRLLAKPPLS